MDMTGMKGMPGMETTNSVIVATESSPFTRATTASAQTPWYREDVASNELPNDGSMAPMSGMSNALHFGIGDTLWTKPLTPTNGQGYFGAILLLMIMALLLRFLATARGMAEKRWNHETPSCCKGIEANNFVKVAQPPKDTGDARSGHEWNATVQLIRATFTLGTMMIGYLLSVSLSIMLRGLS